VARLLGLNLSHLNKNQKRRAELGTDLFSNAHHGAKNAQTDKASLSLVGSYVRYSFGFFIREEFDTRFPWLMPRAQYPRLKREGKTRSPLYGLGWLLKERDVIDKFSLSCSPDDARVGVLSVVRPRWEVMKMKEEFGCVSFVYDWDLH